MAYGLIPVNVGGGGTPSRLNTFMEYTIADQYNTDLFQGDPVKVVAGGTIERAAATEVIAGVFWGVEYVPATGAYAGRPIFDSHWPASTDATGTVKAYVIDDPNTVFMIEADQDTTPLTIADQGAGIDITAGAGSAVTKRSGFFVDSSGTKGTTGQLRILGSAEQDDQYTAAGTAMDIRVIVAEHFWKTVAASV